MGLWQSPFDFCNLELKTSYGIDGLALILCQFYERNRWFFVYADYYMSRSMVDHDNGVVVMLRLEIQISPHQRVKEDYLKLERTLSYFPHKNNNNQERKYNLKLKLK